jgi:hypothetical protein
MWVKYTKKTAGGEEKGAINGDVFFIGDSWESCYFMMD